MNSYIALALSAHGPPSILEPLAPSFRTTTTTTTSTTTTTTTTTMSTPFSNLLGNLTMSTAINLLFNENTTLNNNSWSIHDREPRFSISSMVLMGIIAAVLSIFTVLGNVMVMVSFKIDKQLQTISNYFLFSLAIADFAIGLISMPLFAVTTILGYWPLGPHICDAWLALDYLASNASVLNLLIISFDRYFSVTRPLTYRAKRTNKRAAIMIAAAWGISLVLWPPWIYSWPYIEGKRTVPEDACYIQFIETNQYITFGTALAAFYFPVTIMCFLYYRIWRETKKRQKDLPNLQAGKKDSSKRSNSSDENTVVNHTSGMLSFAQLAASGGSGGGTNDHDTWRRPRSESSADAESVYMTNMIIDSGYHGMHSRKSSIKSTQTINKKAYSCFSGIKEWCIAWWHSGREDSDDFNYEQEEPSDLGYATPVSIETPLQSAVTRCTSMNVMRDSYSIGGSLGASCGVGGNVRPPSILLPDVSPTPMRPSLMTLTQRQEFNGSTGGISTVEGGGGTASVTSSAITTSMGGGGGGGDGGGTGGRDLRSLPTSNNNRIGSRSVSQDSVYTILIRLPSDSGATASNGGTNSGFGEAPSIKMIHEDVPMPLVTILHAPSSSTSSIPPQSTVTTRRPPLSSRESEYSLTPLGGCGGPGGSLGGSAVARRMSQATNADMRIPLNAKIIPKQLTGKAAAQLTGGIVGRNAAKKKKKSQEKRQESKAAKTLSAILLSFIITWTPYNILVLIKPLTSCSDCIPRELWDFFYALCYINSTINPMCYALCNASFRRTYIRILTCKWHARNREGMVRGVYN